MIYGIEILILVIYFGSAAVLMLYGLNAYVMIFLFKKGIEKALKHRKNIWENFDYDDTESFPLVTTQVPVFNEFNVIERSIRAVCGMAYPEGRHEIQILDDSNDETSSLIDAIVSDMQKQGHWIEVIRRDERTGFKAGALANGMEYSEGEIVAVFDADFVPPEDYLLKSIPFFMNDENIGLVQARWGHLNRKKTLLTRAQSIGIDGHFLVEQSARNWGRLFMNFNGTAGLWRKKAIVEGGGWQWDTLTEDMDLSYRVQFKGWDTLFLPDVVVPAEIPEDIDSFKSQQFRWAKGSMETAIKLLPSVFMMKIPFFKKLEAFFHLTHYMVHLLMVILAVLALPVILFIDNEPNPVFFIIIAVFLVFAMAAPSALYIVSQKSVYKSWFLRILWLPVLVLIGTGIAVSNSRAVIEAIIGKKSGFIRTPKKGDKQQKNYKAEIPVSAIVEVILGVYCFISFLAYLAYGKYLVGPFLAIYSAGFLCTGLLTIYSSRVSDGS